MSLADRETKPDTRTKFEKWLDSLNEQNRAVVLRWLNDPSVSNPEIVRRIATDDADDDFTGYKANKDTVADWRRKHVAR